MILYPALDVLDGNAARLKRGDFTQSRVYSARPEAVLSSFHAAGARFAHLVDLNGARDPKDRQKVLLARLLRSSGLKLQVGGGVRSRSDVVELLSWGADRVVIGSVVVTDPMLGTSLLAELGPARITFALDVKPGADGRARVVIKGWTETSGILLEDLLARLRPAGLTRVLCTDVSRDGVAQGPNVELYRRLVAQFPDLEIQASGGVRDLVDVAQLKAAGVHSVVVGTALYEATLDLGEALRAC